MNRVQHGRRLGAHLSVAWARCCLAVIVGLVVAVTLRADTSQWQSVVWQEERAFESTCGSWRAVVSVERGRLVHFGPTNGESNLLFTTPTREHPHGWGGHRVWLGPQSTWPSGGWPPPATWERSPAAEVAIKAGRLELLVPSIDGEWPAFTRVYEWVDNNFVCRVEVHAGGTRDVQVVQILQVSPLATAEVTLRPQSEWPAGYVGLPQGQRRAVQTLGTPPAHATIDGGKMTLRHLGEVEKLGFLPQPLRGQLGNLTFAVGRGQEQGSIIGEPDAGFYTQVYLGGREPFIEFEQLSPLWRAGTPAVFEMVIRTNSAKLE